MSREGSLEAPTRHPIAWKDEAFHDAAKLDAEMRRVFDICHGCRRCFNLCDSFPRLFDLIDSNPTEDVDGVKSEDFSKVTEACTLCDMCFMTKCPYVPPHAWQVDFPHLLLRHRMVNAKDNKTGFVARQLAEMDRNGTLARPIAPLANWASAKENSLTRPLMEKTLGLDAHAELPKFVTRTFVSQDRAAAIAPNKAAPAFGRRKCAIYATCFVNYNKPATGMAARAVLNHIGVETRAAYPGCCGMPFLEQAELDRVAAQAVKVSRELCALIDEGYDIVTLTASCGLMLKFEWPLILPEDENVKKLSKATFDIDEYVIDISKRHGLPDGLKPLPEGYDIVTLTASCGLMLKFEWPLILPDNENVKKLSKATFDIDEYVIDISKRHGLPDGLKPLPEGISIHMACHARAQNMGAKAAELLRLIPDTPIDVIERCAGHGGTFGVLKETHAIAMKVGRPVMRSLVNQGRGHVVSDCPLAGKHIVQGAREIAGKDGKEFPAKAAEHPIEVFAHAYGLI